MTVLLMTSIGRRVQLLRHFMEAGIRVVGVDMNPELSPAAQFADKVYRVPAYDAPEYIKRLQEICRQEAVKHLIPLYEPELLGMAEHADIFTKECGTDIIVSDVQALQTCLDKHMLYLFFVQNHVRTPRTWLPEEWEQEYIKNQQEKEAKYVVKPRKGMASKGVYIINNKKKVGEVLQKVKKNSPIVQQFIDGTEYTIDAFVDKKGKVRSVVPRERVEVRSGEVSKSVTRYDEEIITESIRILQMLSFYGPITLQGIRSHADGLFYFTEINPRFGGGVPLSIAAGVSYAELILGKIPGEKLVPFEENLLMLRYDDAVFMKGFGR